MKRSRSPQAIICSVAALVLAGCSGARFKEDPKEVKAAQLASLGEPGSNKIAGQSLKAFFRGRTAWVIPQTNIRRSTDNPEEIENFDPVTYSGRAGALTADGYFLTAAHVVEKAPPALISRGMRLHEGRVVRTFPKVDLAIIKFPVRVTDYFGQREGNPAKGDTVYSSAPHGVEPFEVKGRIKSVGRHWRSDDIIWMECDLPSLEGSSGTPVANADGELVGIIVGGLYSRITTRELATEVRMLAPSAIEQIIAADRAAEH